MCYLICVSAIPSCGWAEAKNGSVWGEATDDEVQQRSCCGGPLAQVNRENFFLSIFILLF